jgi:hypothetical protein
LNPSLENPKNPEIGKLGLPKKEDCCLTVDFLSKPLGVNLYVDVVIPIPG